MPLDDSYACTTRRHSRRTTAIHRPRADVRAQWTEAATLLRMPVLVVLIGESGWRHFGSARQRRRDAAPGSGPRAHLVVAPAAVKSSCTVSYRSCR